MTTVNNDNRTKSSQVGTNRWTRVREAYQSGELDRQNVLINPEHKRPRRNALADISTVSTNENVSSQKHQFHQLVERVRELQKEIVPDLLLYQMPSPYAQFSGVPQNANTSRRSISMYPRRQSISISSGSSNSSVHNQRFGLSSRILERAHQIPERFWIDWQQKQMQDQIEELEYIKNNMDFSSCSSLLSNETDENGMDAPLLYRQNTRDGMRRESLFFLQEAHRLANERRASLARTTAIDALTPKTIERLTELSDHDDHSSFNFDQRSEDSIDTANLNEVSSDPIAPIPTAQKSSPITDRSRSPDVDRSQSPIVDPPPSPIPDRSQSPIAVHPRSPTPDRSHSSTADPPRSPMPARSRSPTAVHPRSPTPDRSRSSTASRPCSLITDHSRSLTPECSRLPISLPFTYTNTQKQIKFSNNYHQICTEPMLEKKIDTNNEAIQITSPTNSSDDVAQINTEVNVTLLKREHPEEIRPLLYSKATVNRSIEFHKFRPLLSRNTMMSLQKNQDTIIPISIFKRKEREDSRSPSPTLSFKSARSRLSSIDNNEHPHYNIRSTYSVIPSSLSVSSRSRPSSSHSISSIIQCCDHNNNNYSSSSLSEEELSYKCTYFKRNQSMNNVNNLEQKFNSSSCSSCSITSSKEENNLSFSHTLFTDRHRRRKKKTNALNLSLVSTPSSKNNLPLLCDSLCQAKENDNNNNNNNNKNIFKIAHNTSIISSKRTREWKQNDGGFQHDVLTNDNSGKNVDDDDHVSCSSSSSAAAAADCFIQRQRRKQTRLKRKTGSEKRNEKKKKKKKERNKKSPSSNIEAEATEASLFQSFAVDTPAIDTSTIFYPYEPTRSVDKNTAKEENCFSIQTSGEHHQQQKQKSKFHLTMADDHGHTTPNPTVKKKENVRVFVRRRRRTSKHQKRVFLNSSSSSNNSHETIPSSSSSTNNVEELVSMIEQQINKKQKKSRNNKNIIVVNYKPVFVNSRQQQQQQKSSQSTRSTLNPISKPKIFPTDDDFSSATHYSRRRSLTTTSSDGSPLRSTTNRSHNDQSISLDVPDVEDPLMFIEMMYQQLFTEDGQLRSGTEPTVLANCVKQIVTNSRRNSISSSITNGTPSTHLKHRNSNTAQQQRKFSSPSYHPPTPSKPISLSSSPHFVASEHYTTFSEEEEGEKDEEEEEPKTLVQTIKTNTDLSRRNSKRLVIDNADNHTQIHAFLNSFHQKQTLVNRTTTSMNNGFHLSFDDTDNEDLDTFSDLNSIRFNNKTIGTSPSVDEDLTHTDSRLLSSSGYQSLDRSRKPLQQQQKLILSKSHSENDLSHSLHKNDTQIKCIHYCPNCIRPPTITVIPPLIPTSSSSSSTNIIQRLHQPLGMMLMKYLNFILISKNVLLLPLFIFLLRQRSMHIGN